MPARRRAIKKPWTDPDDAPELDDDFFERAATMEGDVVIRRGRGRPKGSGSKVAMSLRLDRDVVDAFRGTGAGWQTRINDSLRRAASQLKTAGMSSGRAMVPRLRIAVRQIEVGDPFPDRRVIERRRVAGGKKR